MPYQDGRMGCPVEKILNIISGKWKPIILYELFQGTKRFGELKRAIPGITRQVLTNQLREMEKDGLISRKVYPVVPPKVEYQVTGFGLSLEPSLLRLAQLGQTFEETLTNNES